MVCGLTIWKTEENNILLGFIKLLRMWEWPLHKSKGADSRGQRNHKVSRMSESPMHSGTFKLNPPNPAKCNVIWGSYKKPVKIDER